MASISQLKSKIVARLETSAPYSRVSVRVGFIHDLPIKIFQKMIQEFTPKLESLLKAKGFSKIAVSTASGRLVIAADTPLTGTKPVAYQRRTATGLMWSVCKASGLKALTYKVADTVTIGKTATFTGEDVVLFRLNSDVRGTVVEDSIISKLKATLKGVQISGTARTPWNSSGFQYVARLKEGDDVRKVVKQMKTFKVSRSIEYKLADFSFYKKPSV